MAGIAIIGGTGLATLRNLEIRRREVMRTPYGEPSGPLLHGDLGDTEVVFLPRHGRGHTIPPHMVNYRANIWALRETGVQRVIAVAAVGGIRQDMAPGRLAFPDQIIDYTWSRMHTYFEQDLSQVTHVEFTEPYSAEVRGVLIEAARSLGLEAVENGTYGATQGPRLETRAEIDRMERDGCDLVGMTGMPEAALARELELEYACCAVIANWAAGRGEGTISMEAIETHLAAGMEKVRSLLERAIPMAAGRRSGDASPV
ncbi:MAG: S-methyl-5'-thioinosine phosphorylase [Gammaproteobacteria bacterium]|jgi:5'-deoxy-5'-methylthioadenosine phosphorylase